ncbi:acyl-CoA thioesterase [Zunongwangia endophytica]|uniref:Acyl-CoA thioesterase n=1 Tax=Zunongwangia endophytica TaxID=1808945 RepID=A0ABV8H7H0_9FLAO|nr:acyl-CoA thioesterase [Zunongwangia endophytica]MDN3595598.1 acyl-CoA thioesterase [Zunongwangia endophytica]
MFKLELKLRIDWSDLDMYRHVNNLSFMRFMQSGRVNLWEATGLHKMYTESKKGAMLVSTHCDFKKTLHYPGNVLIKTRIAEIGTKSFKIEHHILNDNQEICAIGKDVAVFYNFKEEQTNAIPDDLRAILNRY